MLDGLVEPTGCEYDGVLLVEELPVDGLLVEPAAEPLPVVEVLSVLEAGGVEVDDGVDVLEGEVVLDGL